MKYTRLKALHFYAIDICRVSYSQYSTSKDAKITIAGSRPEDTMGNPGYKNYRQFGPNVSKAFPPRATKTYLDLDPFLVFAPRSLGGCALSAYSLLGDVTSEIFFYPTELKTLINAAISKGPQKNVSFNYSNVPGLMPSLRRTFEPTTMPYYKSLLFNDRLLSEHEAKIYINEYVTSRKLKYSPPIVYSDVPDMLFKKFSDNITAKMSIVQESAFSNLILKSVKPNSKVVDHIFNKYSFLQAISFTTKPFSEPICYSRAFASASSEIIDVWGNIGITGKIHDTIRNLRVRLERVIRQDPKAPTIYTVDELIRQIDPIKSETLGLQSAALIVMGYSSFTAGEILRVMMEDKTVLDNFDLNRISAISPLTSPLDSSTQNVDRISNVGELPILRWHGLNFLRLLAFRLSFIYNSYITFKLDKTKLQQFSKALTGRYPVDIFDLNDAIIPQVTGT